MTQGFQPIFVLGLQRSGTTWAANLLAAHPQIAAVEAQRHHGVHESVFFSHFAKVFDDWNDPTCRGQAVETFVKSDYFVLSNLSPAQVQAIAQETKNATEFFVAVMDEVAATRGAIAWVEKSPHHTLLADELVMAVPNAKFLCITRSSKTLVRSRLWSYGRTPPAYPARAFLILRACASNNFHSRYLQSFVKTHGQRRARLITFENLKRDGSRGLDPFLAECGLNPMNGVQSEYSQNSSFGSEISRKAALHPVDRFLVSVCDLAVSCVPAALLKRFQRRISAKRPTDFPTWFWANEELQDDPKSSKG